MVHGLSCSVARGILPDQRSNLCPLHWQEDSQPLCYQGSPLVFLFEIFNLAQLDYLWSTQLFQPETSKLIFSFLSSLLPPALTQSNSSVRILNFFFFLATPGKSSSSHFCCHLVSPEQLQLSPKPLSTKEL